MHQQDENNVKCFVHVCYLRGQDGWRHLVTKIRLGGDLGLGATSALCYAAATHHRVYILSREDTNTEMVKKLVTHLKMTGIFHRLLTGE